MEWSETNMLQQERKERLRKEAEALVQMGEKILYAQSYRFEMKKCSDETERMLKELDKKYPLNRSYQNWYSKCLSFLSVFGRDRIDEFKQLYQLKSRKEINAVTYGISDYLQGVSTTRGSETQAYDSTFFMKMQIQIGIVHSVCDRINSIFEDMFEQIRFDVLRSDLAAAATLKKAGFCRAGGALAGVALEAHLTTVCQRRGVLPKKKDPSLNDLSQALKDGDIIETTQWRFIQHLADIRNKCAHHKASEPTSEEVGDLIAGVDKIMTTVG